MRSVKCYSKGFAFLYRQYPVNHYIKEAKKLKHKADAEVIWSLLNCPTVHTAMRIAAFLLLYSVVSLQQDKLSKAFTYLEAAMFFVESGIAMEKDPQISMSSYTMFAETVELLK